MSNTEEGEKNPRERHKTSIRYSARVLILNHLDQQVPERKDPSYPIRSNGHHPPSLMTLITLATSVLQMTGIAVARNYHRDLISNWAGKSTP